MQSVFVVRALIGTDFFSFGDGHFCSQIGTVVIEGGLAQAHQRSNLLKRHSVEHVLYDFQALRGCEWGAPAGTFAALLSLGYSSFCALDEHVAFKLCEYPDDVVYRLTGCVGCVDTLGQRYKFGTLPPNQIGCLDQFRQVSTQSVHLPDNQPGARVERFERSLQAKPA